MFAEWWLLEFSTLSSKSATSLGCNAQKSASGARRLLEARQRRCVDVEAVEGHDVLVLEAPDSNITAKVDWQNISGSRFADGNPII